ncbi:hypothetical protein C2I18_13085 [Paenibacillus sp. PK3_47]|uniref:polysaccharide lyase family 8 super-sandwich domain-containing protein n=1 Tax=Paenibacillus sp. PK3_47 TaxID=2072642 RepID=UPI00201D62F6|nr:polysaccharide lyase family 8 super-sandwich domain-containing protein [Paenibacillus sp. PK3_47]UQZ34370.1 hypothetical protein C2I18_13085 [Paenibacillus sp. PK3_47]
MKSFRSIRTFTLLFVCIALTITGLPLKSAYSATLDPEYDTARGKWFDMLAGGLYDASDPDIAAAIQSITAKAQDNWKSMNKVPAGRTYLWSDLAANSTNPTHIRLSYQKLYEMALAYQTAGSSLQGDPGLRDSVLEGLEFLYGSYYNNSVTPYGNWWEWEIGAPLALNDSVVLMYDELSSAAVQNYMNAIQHFAAGPKDTGANRVWSCAITIGRGILSQDETLIRKGVNGLSPVFGYVTSGDGFYEDGSFIQHEKFAYNGSYGLSLIENLSTALYLVTGTSWDVTDPASENVYRWVNDSFIPFVYKGALMDMVRGRDISVFSRQDHATGHRMIAAIVKIAQSAPEQEALRYKSMIKYWLQNDTTHSVYENQSIDFIQRTKAIMANPHISPAKEPVQTKIYSAMDRAVHLRPGFGIGISMFSKRIANFETTNGQNLKGWYTGAGMTYLYNGDSNQYGENYWPTVNAYRMPGTTAVNGKPMTAESLSPQTWAGGTALSEGFGTVGLSFEHLGADVTSAMQAKKSWFLFDDEMVALGTGITSTYGSNDVETIVENRKINTAGDNPLTVNGILKPSTAGWSETMTGVKWAHLAGSSPGSDIGYYFPGVATIEGLREERSGKWFDISKYSGVLEPGNPTHTNRFLNLYFNHGTAPTDASYAYALLPNQTAAQVSSYAGNPDFIVLANNSSVQAVKEKKLHAVGANFWTQTEQSVDIIKSSGKAAVMVKENPGSDLFLAVSDPNQPASGTVTLTLDKSARSVLSADPRITVQRLSPFIQVTVDVGGSKGQPIEAKFALETSNAVHIEAEEYSKMSGIRRTSTTDVNGAYHISGSNGSWAAYKQLDFGPGTPDINLRMATANSGGTLELRMDSETGPLVGSLAVKSTGGWSAWSTITVPLTGANGIHDLYLLLKRPDTLGVASINWLEYQWRDDTSDKTPPIIHLAPDTTEPSGRDIIVTADIQDDSGISVTRWTYGDQPVSYFASGGTALERASVTGTTYYSFNAQHNGVYTVYAQDLAGNEAVSTLKIDNITRGQPAILLIPSPTLPTSGNVSVIAAVNVQSGLASLKYDWGQFDMAHFTKGGGIILSDPSVPIEATENGWITVYIRDGAGNEKLQQIQVSNIDRDKPLLTLLGESVVQIAQGSNYQDDGVIAEDATEGDLASRVIVTGNPVDTSKSGIYKIYYDVTDTAGNAADRVERTVKVTTADKPASQPQWPAGSSLDITDIAPTSLKLNWPYATDDTGVAGYRLYVNGTELADIPGDESSYTLTGLTPDTKYNVKLTAYNPDDLENEGLTLVVYTLRSSGDGGSTGSITSGSALVSPGNTALQQVELHADGQILPLSFILLEKEWVYRAETRLSSAAIKAVPADSTAVIRLKNAQVDEHGLVLLREGDNVFEIEVSTADGASRIYPLIIHRTAAEPAGTVPVLTDLSGHWAEQSVSDALSDGIISGYPDGSFRPDQPVTRAEFAVLLMKALHLEAGSAELAFTDRSLIGAWAQGAISAAVESKVIKGYSDGSFKPASVLSRAEMAVMIARALGQEPASHKAADFEDHSSIPEWAAGSVQLLGRLGIVNGRGGNLFQPQAPATRAEVVVTLQRMLEQQVDL